MIIGSCVCVSVCVHTKSLQLCPTLCHPIDCSSPDYSIREIPQARILEWVAMSSSRGSSWPRNWICISLISCIGRQVLYHWATWEARCIESRVLLGEERALKPGIGMPEGCTWGSWTQPLIHPDAPCCGRPLPLPLLKLSSLIWRPSNSHTPEAGADACSFQVGLPCLLCSRPVTRQVSARWRRKQSLGCWEGPTRPGSTGPAPGCQKTRGAPGGWESRGGRQGWVQGVIYNRRTSADVGHLWLHHWTHESLS